MKKTTKMGALLASVSLLTGIGVVAVNQGNQLSFSVNAENNYSLVLSESNYTSDLVFNVQTALGNNVSFEKEGISSVDGMFGSFSAGASLSNKDAITGISSITVSFKEGETGSLRVSYVVNEVWFTSVSLDALNPSFNFNGVEP